MKFEHLVLTVFCLGICLVPLIVEPASVEGAVQMSSQSTAYPPPEPSDTAYPPPSPSPSETAYPSPSPLPSASATIIATLTAIFTDTPVPTETKVPTATDVPVPSAPDGTPLVACPLSLPSPELLAAQQEAMRRFADRISEGRWQRCNNNVPSSPDNVYRISVELRAMSKPYNPLGNGFTLKCGCTLRGNLGGNGGGDRPFAGESEPASEQASTPWERFLDRLFGRTAEPQAEPVVPVDRDVEVLPAQAEPPQAPSPTSEPKTMDQVLEYWFNFGN